MKEKFVPLIVFNYFLSIKIFWETNVPIIIYYKFKAIFSSELFFKNRYFILMSKCNIYHNCSNKYNN